jgi:hypothetical protein
MIGLIVLLGLLEYLRIHWEGHYVFVIRPNVYNVKLKGWRRLSAV